MLGSTIGGREGLVTRRQGQWEKDTCKRVDKKVQLQAQLNRTKWNRELERKKLS